MVAYVDLQAVLRTYTCHLAACVHELQVRRGIVKSLFKICTNNLMNVILELQKTLLYYCVEREEL